MNLLLFHTSLATLIHNNCLDQVFRGNRTHPNVPGPEGEGWLEEFGYHSMLFENPVSVTHIKNLVSQPSSLAALH
jgi:hypothetical protein